MLRRLSLAIFAVSLVVAGLVVGPVTAGAAGPVAPTSTAPLTETVNENGTRTLEWSLQGSSDEINVLPNLRCELGPGGGTPRFDQNEPCLWLVDHKAPLPASAPDDCLPGTEPGRGGGSNDDYASWRCDMSKFRDVIIRAAQGPSDRSFVMFNTKATGGSGFCATIPITVRLGQGHGELQAADGCPQTIRCEASYRGTIKSDPLLDTVSGCTATPQPPPGGSGGGSGGASGGSSPGTGGGGSKVPPAPGSSSSSSSAKKQKTDTGKACPGASSGNKGNSPLYSVYIKAQGKRGMKIYVHMRRAVPITVDVRMRRSGRTPKIVRWVSRCAKKGTNVITFPNATGGAQNRRNYRVYVKSPNSTYPLRASWEALPRR